MRRRFTRMSPSSLIDLTNFSQELGGWEDAQQGIAALLGGHSRSPSRKAPRSSPTSSHSTAAAPGRRCSQMPLWPNMRPENASTGECWTRSTGTATKPRRTRQPESWLRTLTGLRLERRRPGGAGERSLRRAAVAARARGTWSLHARRSPGFGTSASVASATRPPLPPAVPCAPRYSRPGWRRSASARTPFGGSAGWTAAADRHGRFAHAAGQHHRGAAARGARRPARCMAAIRRHTAGFSPGISPPTCARRAAWPRSLETRPPRSPCTGTTSRCDRRPRRGCGPRSIECGTSWRRDRGAAIGRHLAAGEARAVLAPLEGER